MRTDRLESLLEHPERAAYYDLLGGLSDNLLTLGPYAGKFFACSDCGETFNVRDQSWTCENCGTGFRLKFEPPAKAGVPFTTKVTVSGLRKSRMNPHWYYENENWSVAEFLTQVLRLPPDDFLVSWLRHVGLRLDPASALESTLCWPRFGFGPRTIQPDFAIGFREALVFFEFKQPGGGVVPATELIGQIAFAMHAASKLDRPWHLVLVPGPDESVSGDPARYVAAAMGGLLEASEKWEIPESVRTAIRTSSPDAIANHVHVIGWEGLLRRTLDVVGQPAQQTWAHRQARDKLGYFWRSRAALGLLRPPVES
jgi:hypothetical protein